MYFPSLILQEICGYCDHRTWVATCSVSREWREASLHHRFKRLEVASDTAISHLSHLFPHVLSLSLYNISSYGLRRIAEVLKRDCHVQSLSLVRCHASDSAFAYLLQSMTFKHFHLNLELCSTLSDFSLAQVALVIGSHLQSLRVSACPKMSDEGLQDILLGCSHFESLTLGGNREFTSRCFRFKTKLPHFKAIHFETGLRSIGDQALFGITEFAKESLQELSLYLSESMSTDGLRFLMEHCPKLNALTVSTEDYRVYQMTMPELGNLLQLCHSLETLILKHSVADLHSNAAIYLACQYGPLNQGTLRRIGVAPLKWTTPHVLREMNRRIRKIYENHQCPNVPIVFVIE